MCNVYLAWYIYTAQWIWFGIYPGEPACKKTCGSVHPRPVGQLSDTISSPWNRPKISDSKSGLPKPARPPRRIRLLTMATSLLLSSAISAPIARRLLLLAGARAPIRSPSLAYSGRAAPSLRRGFDVRSQQQQSGCTVRTLFFFCIEHFDVEVMEWSAIKKKDAWVWFCLCYVSFLSAVVRIFRWFDDFAQLVLSYYERVSIHVEE